MVTADGSVERTVAALDIGADDYVTKPFSMPELLARVRVALRHGLVNRPDDVAIQIGNLRMDVAAHVVTVGDTRSTCRRSPSSCSPRWLSTWARS